MRKQGDREQKRINPLLLVCTLQKQMYCLVLNLQPLVLKSTPTSEPPGRILDQPQLKTNKLKYKKLCFIDNDVSPKHKM